MTTIFPIQVPLIDSRNMIDRRWSLALQTAFASSGGTGTANILFGLASDRPAPVADTFYLATDTGEILFSNGLTWSNFSAPLTGDVIKSSNSNVTSLADVFVGPGTYGNSTLTPVLTVDSKGRLTALSFEVITAVAAGQGFNGALQFNNSGAIAGANITFNQTTGGLNFFNPAPTREALSPLTTQGDIFIRNAIASTRLPVGTPTQVLTADPTDPNGLVWSDNGVFEIIFNFGDATPKPLFTVPADKIIQEVIIFLEIEFDDVASTLSVGDAGDVERLLATTDILPSVAGAYSTEPNYKYGVATMLTLSISPGTASQGRGLVKITFEK